MNEQTATTQSNLTLKIAKIMNELGAVAKQPAHNYNAHSIGSVTGALRPVMARHNVAVFPEIIGIETNNNSNLLRMTFTLIDGDSGDSRTMTWLNIFKTGNDPDKSTGAAISYATKNFLMRTFMISEEGEPETDFNPVTVEEPKQSSNGKTAQHPDNEAIKHLDGKVVEITRLERRKHDNVNQEKVWFGKFDYDDDPMIQPCSFFDNHLADLDWILGYSTGSIQKKLSSESIDFPVKLHIKLMVDKKGKLKPAPRHEQDHTFNNPMVLRSFLLQYPNISDRDLCEYLGVKTLESYTGDINGAKTIIQRKLNGDESKEPIDIQNVYRKSQGGTKQTQLDKMPTVDGDLAATKET